jgi:putative transposase
MCNVRPGTYFGTFFNKARDLVKAYVVHYNTVRLHSAIGYITPEDKLEGLAEAIHKRRQEKLSAAQAHRQQVYAQRIHEVA